MRGSGVLVLCLASAVSALVGPAPVVSGHALRSCERLRRGNTIVIQGVLHGAASSAAAVRDALDAHVGCGPSDAAYFAPAEA